MRNFGRFYEFTFFELPPFTKNPDGSNSSNQIITDVTAKTGFKIKNSLNFKFNYTRTPNSFSTATFYFYNLSNESLNYFASKNNRKGFRLYCCYERDTLLKTSLIFQGLTLRCGPPYRVGEDIVTEVVAGDSFFGLLQAAGNFSYNPGTFVGRIVQDISNYLGVFNAFSGVDYLTIKESYNHPLSFSNTPITKILNMIAADNICTWNYDTDGIKFFPLKNHPKYSSIPIVNPILINNQTGLIGNVKPESLAVSLYPIDYYSQQRLKDNQPWVSATILMRPITLNSTINLQCEIKELSGFYFVFGYSYDGEFRGTPWFVNLKLNPIRSTM